MVFAKSLLIPKTQSIYDFIYVRKNLMGTWTTWTSLIESQALGNIISRTEQIITTSETVRQTFFINKLVEMKKMVLLVGPTGTGKTSVIKSYLYRVPKDEYLINNLNFSARTTASQTQDTILSKLTRY